MPLDDFFNYVVLQDLRIAPDGSAVVFSTRRPDWQHNRYRLDLWIVRQDGSPQLLADSGHDSDPEWSPDGKWIAFTSSREFKLKGELHCNGDQIFIIPAAGGKALPVTCEENSVHAFAWAPDSRILYFSMRQPWEKTAHAAYEKQWKDVIQYREADRGDVIEKTDVAAVLERSKTTAQFHAGSVVHPRTLASLSRVVSDIAISHDGQTVAFSTGPASHRREDIRDYEIFLLSSNGGTPRQLTRNNATENSLNWGPRDREVFFTTYGNPVGPPEQVQERTYSVDVHSGRLERWGASFPGAIGGTYSIARSGVLIASGVMGTETAIYTQSSPMGNLEPIPVPRGSFASFSMASNASKVAFIHSAWGSPAEVYLADDIAHLSDAKPITHFNQAFKRYELPQGRNYQWTADDGTKIEGVLLYPPGKFGRKHLPTLTLIHGGPANTDGDQFRADWYDWSVLAAMHGYLVFRPNYRGSAAYGDSFLQQISPHIVSLPGRDILSGVDALVKEGIADPEKLAVAGYSYGGFLTNWLITQTTQFKAAMTGAGAVEHIMQWGNDDLPLEDIESLKGYPWEVPQNYHDEAAIFQMNKVNTPTHIVAGSVDSRVYVGEQFLLERSLYALGVPHTLLLFPGEEHLLRNNPWHGKIKVREELSWLEKYCPLVGKPGSANGGAQ